MAATHVLILAGGKSSRFKTKSSKVLYPICGRPAIQYLLGNACRIKAARSVIVIAPQFLSDFKKVCAPYSCNFVSQRQPKGSGDAVRIGLGKLPKSGRVLILSGDVPLLTTLTIRRLIHAVESHHAIGGLVSMILPDGGPYGRVVKDDAGYAVKVVEARDCTEEERDIQEVNAGIYCVDITWLRSVIARLGRHNAQGEYYLTDIVRMACDEGLRFTVVPSHDPNELLGMNTRAEAAAIAVVQRLRINTRHMDAGVSVIDPGHTYIDDTVTIEDGCTIWPNVFLLGATRIGSRSTIHPGAVIESCRIGNHAEIKAYSMLQDSVVGNHAVVGPYARLRPGSRLADGAHVGNFVEIKKSVLGKGAKANHLSYIGDADIGAGTNVGCGTITCNYDGVKKNRTKVGKNVFIGSDVAFVAPVVVKDGATIAAGSVITDTVPAKSLAIARSRQVVINGWKSKRK